MPVSGIGNSIDPSEFSFGQEVEGQAQLVNQPGITDTIDPNNPFGVEVTVSTPEGIIRIPAGRMTIGMFADILGQSINNSHATLRRGDLGDLLANAKLAGNALANNLLNMIIVSNLVQNIGDAVDELTLKSNQDIQTMKDAIAQFNTDIANGQSPAGEDANQIAALNQAIDDYNAGTITQAEFNTAVDNYNAYQASRNTDISAALATYNAAVATYTAAVAANNATIDQINAAIVELNTHLDPDKQIAQLPYQTTAGVPDASGSLLPTAQNSPPLTVPIPNSAKLTAPSPLLDGLTLLTVPDVSTAQELRDVLVIPTTQDLLDQINLYDTMLDLHNSITDYYIFTRAGKRLFQPAAFIQNASPVFFNSAGSGGGITNVTLTILNGNPDLGRAIHQGAFQADQQLLGLNFSTRFVPALARELAFQSGVTAVGVIGAGGITAQNAEQVFGTAFGLTYAQAIAEVISSGVTSQAVEEAAVQSDRASQDVKQDVVQTQNLKAAANTQLLQTALFVAALNFGAPELLAQLNGNVAGGAAAAPPSALTFAQVLQDPNKQLYAKTVLAEALVQQTNLSQLQAQEIINTALNTLAQNQALVASQDYADDLEKILVQGGINAATAKALALQAKALAETEQHAQDIVNSALFVQEEAARALADRLQKLGIEDDRLANQAVEELFRSSVITNANEYQAELQKHLVNLGIRSDLAETAAKDTVVNLNIAPAAISPNELAQRFYSTVYNNTLATLGSEHATLLANQAARTFVTGPQSILSLLNTQRTERQADIFRAFQSPSVDLYAFADQLRDPGRTFLYSAATGLMYNGMPEPSNFKKSVDIAV